MATNKNNPKKDGSKGSMSNTPDREFEIKGKNKDFDKESQQAGSSAKPSGSSFIDDDEMNTAGGRQGEFSDKDREDKAKWSPGSGGSLNE